MNRSSFTLIILFLLGFFYTAATGSIVTVEALYVKRVLHASFLRLGFIFSLAALAYAMLAPFLGVIADKFGKAKFLTMTLLLMSLLALLAVFVTDAIQYLPVKIFITILSPLAFPLLVALLTDLFGGRSHEGRLFSLFYISPALGGSFGSFAGGSLGERFGLQSAFIFSAVLFLAAAVLAAVLIAEEEPRPFFKRRPSLSPIPSFRKIVKQPALAVLVLLSVLFYLHWFTRDMIYPFFLESVGKNVADLGRVFASMGVAAAVVMLVGGELLDRIGSRKTLLVAFLLMSVAALLIPSTSIFTLFWAFNLVYAAGEALFSPAQLKVIADLVEKGRRAEITASLSSFTAIIGVVWPLALGWLMEAGTFSFQSIIFLAGISVALGAVVSATFMLRINVQFDRLPLTTRLRGLKDAVLKKLVEWR